MDELQDGRLAQNQEDGRESLTQAVGRAVFSNGGEGLLSVSARVPEGINVAYFPERRHAESQVEVLDAAKLERVKLV